MSKVENKKKSTQPQETVGIAEQLKKKINRLTKQAKNLQVEIDVLEKRLKKYKEGIPKAEGQLKTLKAKKQKVVDAKAKELANVEDLTKAFLPQNGK
jgi:chromosome segregation ATPase